MNEVIEKIMDELLLTQWDTVSLNYVKSCIREHLSEYIIVPKTIGSEMMETINKMEKSKKRYTLVWAMEDRKRWWKLWGYIFTNKLLDTIAVSIIAIIRHWKVKISRWTYNLGIDINDKNSIELEDRLWRLWKINHKLNKLLHFLH